MLVPDTTAPPSPGGGHHEAERILRVRPRSQKKTTLHTDPVRCPESQHCPRRAETRDGMLVKRKHRESVFGRVEVAVVYTMSAVAVAIC